MNNISFQYIRNGQVWNFFSDQGIFPTLFLGNVVGISFNLTPRIREFQIDERRKTKWNVVVIELTNYRHMSAQPSSGSERHSGREMKPREETDFATEV